MLDCDKLSQSDFLTIAEVSFSFVCVTFPGALSFMPSLTVGSVNSSAGPVSAVGCWSLS